MGEEYSETAKFTEMIDKFFDCFNVTNYTSGKHKRKPFQDPYRRSDHDDFRIQVHSYCMYSYNKLMKQKCFVVCLVA